MARGIPLQIKKRLKLQDLPRTLKVTFLRSSGKQIFCQTNWNFLTTHCLQKKELQLKHDICITFSAKGCNEKKQEPLSFLISTIFACLISTNHEIFVEKLLTNN